MTYEPELKGLKTESDIIELLNNVKKDLIYLGHPVSSSSLKEVLNIIEKGEYKIKDEFTLNPVYNLVDLSKAKDFIDRYKHFSEGGCQSCKNANYFKPLSDETRVYCSIGEKEEDAIRNTNSSSRSPKIEKYFKNGCDERKPIFRKLEEVLKDN